MRVRTRLTAVVVSSLLVLSLSATEASAKTPAQRRAEQVEKARQLKTLEANDVQLRQAIKTLDDQVKNADASTESARQSVKAARAAEAQANARLAQTQATMARLRKSVVQRAIDEYTRPNHSVFARMAAGEDINVITRQRALLEQVTSADNDALDQLRATRIDLERQRATAQRARELAEQRQHAVQAQLAQLLRDRATRGKLSAALDRRIEEVRAEAAAIAGDDAAVRGVVSTAVGKVSTSGLMWPLRGRLTSGFGRRWGRLHAGIDIAAPKGTPIRAAKAGTVVFAGVMRGYGNVVIIDHGGGLSTLYGHQSRLGSRRGQKVSQGQVIGFVGSTGHSTGNHCHFETRINGSPQNPRKYLP
jgi:murein DD-endopeptidase MepM/ murein hydrolase activator NlpD